MGNEDGKPSFEMNLFLCGYDIRDAYINKLLGNPQKKRAKKYFIYGKNVKTIYPPISKMET